MIRTIGAIACLLEVCLWGCRRETAPPLFDHQTAYTHEIKPHHSSIPLQGIGIDNLEHNLQLRLTISPTGEVLDAKAYGDLNDLKFWPQAEKEVRRWKFKPFKENGRTVTAEIEEHIELVPPERLPQHYVKAPVLGT